MGKSFETVSVYDAIIRDELNIKKIVYLDDFGTLSNKYLSLNFQTAGRQLKGDLVKVKALCDRLTAAEHERLINMVKSGLSVQMAGYENEIPAGCFSIHTKFKKDIVKSSDGLLIAVNTEITPELKAEGIYREVLRHCQLLRKEAGFAVVDRVTIYFESTSEIIRSVLKAYAKDITRETLSEIQDISTPVMQKEVDLDDGNVTIKIK